MSARRQLSGTDSLFLSMENVDVHGHVGGLVVLDPSGSATFGFERFRRSVCTRLPNAGPEFTARVEEAPLGLARPHLVSDASFDVDRHVRRIALPAPGGRRELAEMVGFLFERKLDRSRPLWEMWFIEGLEKGRVAVFFKTHHALMDGMKGADLSVVLCDLEPEPAPALETSPEATVLGAPSGYQQALEGLGNLAALPARIAGYGMQALRRGAHLVPFVLNNGTAGMPAVAPRLDFNGRIGPGRNFAFTSIPLEDVKAIKDHLGVKVNDVIVALCGEAMVRWAERRGVRPDGSLAVSCPVSTRQATDAEAANKIANMIVSCATDVADPLERVREVHRRANQAKAMTSRLRAQPIDSLGDVLPPSIVHLGFRAAGEFAAWSGTVPANAVVSNVPGPPVPLYMAGARVCGIFPISILAPTQGLNFTAVSFTGRLDIGITADPQHLEDPWEMMACIDAAFEQMRNAYVEQTEASAPVLRRPLAQPESQPVRSIAAA